MSERIRWGILGTGAIARKMAEALGHLPDAELVAVGSRTAEKAREFASRYNIPHRHGSYEDLASDAEVDVIYVATPHNFHCPNTLLCLEHGKAVLCEKPFTVNAGEAERMIQSARHKRLFLMEAMWTRFIPLMSRFKEVLDSGVIGEPRIIRADFGFRAPLNPESRLFNPNLAGGGLLDVGVYAVSFASWVMGNPNRVSGFAHIGETGVDEQCAMVLANDRGQLALLAAAVRTSTPQEADVIGTEGRIKIHAQFWHPRAMTVTVGGKEELIQMEYEGNGFEYQAAEVMNCLRSGKMESAVMPLDESLSIMRTMDQLRAQWGLKYPFE